MLNECYNLLQSLQAAGIDMPSYQQGVVAPGENTGPCLRVRLRENSTISSIEALADEEWPGLWTIMEGNLNSRPVVRLNVPLLRIPLQDPWWASIGYKDSNVTRDRNISDIDRLNALEFALDKPDWLRSFAASANDESYEEKNLVKFASDLWSRVREKSKELTPLLSGADGLAMVKTVFERIGKLPSIGEFAADLTVAIKERLESGTLPVELVELLLVGRLSRKSRVEKWKHSASKVQLAFDVDTGDTIYRRKTKAAIETLLGAQNSKTVESCEPNGRCAFGSKGQLQNTAFPNPRLPIVAEKGMPLVSMFSDAAANTRYRLTDSAIVPVGHMLATRMASALLWATSDEREGKTWRGVASGLFDKSREKTDLLIAYIDGKPDIDAAIADFFGTDQDSLDKQFVVESTVVCDALSAIARESPSSKLNVLVLRQVSPGQVQVVLSKTLVPMLIVKGAKLWNESAENLPPMVIPLPREEGKPPEKGRPRSPYPDQVVRLLSRQWLREGAKKDKQEPFIHVSGPSLGSIIDLLVRDPGKYKDVARDVLHRTLIQVGPLLKGLTGAIHTYDQKHYDQYPLDYRYQALIACSSLGLALHALNSLKEDFMQSSAFAIGKMLALADDIHRSYCEVVRDGSIPPSLLGNSLLSTAMENPARALAVLGDRLKVYIGWAKTASEPQGTDNAIVRKQIAIRTARKRIDQYGPIAELVADQGLPMKMDDVARAHLMLGYLASTKEN